jgi:hypothetical protein
MSGLRLDFGNVQVCGSHASRRRRVLCSQAELGTVADSEAKVCCECRPFVVGGTPSFRAATGALGVALNMGEKCKSDLRVSQAGRPR